MHMALRDMITVKDCESMRVLRSQSRNGVLTMAAFISGHLSDGRYSVASRRVQARSPGRKQDVPSHCSIFAIDFIECFQYCIGIHQLDRRDDAVVQTHQSLHRAAIRSSNVSICASSRSRCQLIVGPPKRRLSQRWPGPDQWPIKQRQWRLQQK